jgi:hypothetical protein
MAPGPVLAALAPLVSSSDPKYAADAPGPPEWQSSSGPAPVSRHDSVRPSAVRTLGVA